MRKTLQTWLSMMLLAILAIGVDANAGVTVTNVWKYTSDLPASGNGRGAAYKDGAVYTIDKSVPAIYKWDKDGKTTISTTAVGQGIAFDDAGNMIVRSNYFAGTTFEFLVYPADGSEAKSLVLDLSAGGRADLLGHVTGDVLSTEDPAKMYIMRASETGIDVVEITDCAQTDTYKINLPVAVNGTAAVAFDADGGIILQQPWTSVIKNLDPDTEETTDYTTPDMNSSGGAAVFELQGVKYVVYPTSKVAGDDNYKDGFAIAEQTTGTVVYTHETEGSAKDTGSLTNWLFVDAIDDSSVNIYQYNSGNVAACYKFEIASTPSFTVTATPDGEKTIEIELMANVADATYTIDWGDGVISDPAAIANYNVDWDATIIKGTPKGEGLIKVYTSTDDIYSVEVSYAADQLKATAIDVTALPKLKKFGSATNALTNIDLSKNVELANLTISSNALENIDLTANTAITSLDLSGNSIASIDLSKNVAITSLKLSNNKFTAVDLTANTVVKNLYVNGNAITKQADVVIGDYSKLTGTVSFADNKLEEFDPSLFAAKAYIFLNNNNLSAITVPATATGRLHIPGNKFTLTSIPQKGSLSTLTYAPQQPMAITAAENVVDLSSQLKVKDSTDADVISTYTWKDAEGNALVAGIDYNENEGVFTFAKEFSGIYCEIANTALPLFTADKAFVTTAVDITIASTPSFTVTATPDGEKTIEIELMANVADATYTIDWGDGVISDPAAIANYNVDWDATLIKGTPKGEGLIKVYTSTDDIYSVEVSYAADQLKATAIDVTALPKLKKFGSATNALTNIDLSKNVELANLTISSNALENIDLTANTAITSLDLSGNSIASIDLSKNVAITSLKLSNNKFTAVDLTANTVVKNLYVNGNAITKQADVVIGDYSKLTGTVSFADNKLEEFNPSVFAAKAYIFLNNNNLSAITVPATATGRLHIPGNKFTLTSIPQKGSLSTLTYAPQQPMAITAAGNVVDLSSQLKVKDSTDADVISTYTWKDAEGNDLVAGTDYNEAEGVFTFAKEFSGIYCEIANTALPLFTADKAFVTTAVDITTPTPPVQASLKEVWKYTTGLPAVGNGRGAAYKDGAIYTIDKSVPAIYKWDAFGKSTIETTAVGQGIAFDDAGNMIVRSNYFAGTTFEFLVYPADGSEAKSLALDLSAGGRSDLLGHVTGDVLSTEDPAKMYIMRASETGIDVVEITDCAQTDTYKINLPVAVNGTAAVAFDADGGIILQQPWTSVIKNLNPDTEETTDYTTPDMNSSGGAAVFELQGVKYVVYPTSKVAGDDNYKDGFAIANQETGEVVAVHETEGSAKDTGSLTNWLFAQPKNDTQVYIYQYNSGNVVAKYLFDINPQPVVPTLKTAWKYTKELPLVGNARGAAYKDGIIYTIDKAEGKIISFAEDGVERKDTPAVGQGIAFDDAGNMIVRSNYFAGTTFQFLVYPADGSEAKSLALDLSAGGRADLLGHVTGDVLSTEDPAKMYIMRAAETGIDVVEITDCAQTDTYKINLPAAVNGTAAVAFDADGGIILQQPWTSVIKNLNPDTEETTDYTTPDMNSSGGAAVFELQGVKYVVYPTSKVAGDDNYKDGFAIANQETGEVVAVHETEGSAKDTGSLTNWLFADVENSHSVAIYQYNSANIAAKYIFDVDPVEAEPIYIIGQVEGQEWNPEVGTELENIAPGVYSGTITFDAAGFETAYFAIATKLDVSWEIVNANRYSGEVPNQNIIPNNENGLVKNGDKSFGILPWEYIVTVNFNDMTITCAATTEIPSQYPERLYLVGTLNENAASDWDPTDDTHTLEATATEGIYEGNITLYGNLAESTAGFKLTSKVGDWVTIDANAYGPINNNDILTANEVSFNMIKCSNQYNIAAAPKQEYKITVNLVEMTILCTTVEGVNDINNNAAVKAIGGVGEIRVIGDAKAIEVYNAAGQLVSKDNKVINCVAGAYIVVVDGTRSKVLVK